MTATTPESSELDRFRGCLLGLACGDAVGTTVEFHARGSFEPVTDMIGGGPFRLKAGEWTDDTSMALCLAASLAETGEFNPDDQMRRYCDWWRKGYMSSNGYCFDIGNTTKWSLAAYNEGGGPFSGSTDPHSAGNGCIMRLAPVPMFAFPDAERAIVLSGESSRTTHGAVECIESSQLFGGILCAALGGAKTEETLSSVDAGRFESPKVRAIAQGDYRNKNIDDIRGSGYVIECLEAALWCFQNSASFEEAVLKAVNLGDDADTTGAVCGQIAGACYGESGIPEHWLSKLVIADEMRNLADGLFAANE